MTRTLLSLAPAAIAAAAAVVTPAAARPPVGQPASIPFADRGGIRDFQPDGSKAVYLQDRAGRWYRGEFLAPCSDIPFADAIAYETDATGRFDKFSRIRTRDQVCSLSSLVTSDAPKGRKARHSKA